MINLMKTNISVRSVLWSIACLMSVAMVLCYWVVHANEYTSIVSNYIDRNKETNDALRLLQVGSIPLAARDTLLYWLYISVPMLLVASCVASIFIEGNDELT